MLRINGHGAKASLCWEDCCKMFAAETAPEGKGIKHLGLSKSLEKKNDLCFMYMFYGDSVNPLLNICPFL